MPNAERLSSLSGYVSFLARSYSPRDKDFQQDLYQDAMEAMWKELLKAEERGVEVNDSFLTQKARWVIKEYYRADKKTPKGADRLHQLVEPGEGDWLLDRPVTEDTDRLFHNPEIRSAIKALSPRQREYVYLRFWHGYQKADLLERGISQANWYGSGKSAGAKTILASRLAHLAGLA